MIVLIYALGTRLWLHLIGCTSETFFVTRKRNFSVWFYIVFAHHQVAQHLGTTPGLSFLSSPLRILTFNLQVQVVCWNPTIRRGHLADVSSGVFLSYMVQDQLATVDECGRRGQFTVLTTPVELWFVIGKYLNDYNENKTAIKTFHLQLKAKPN